MKYFFIVAAMFLIFTPSFAQRKNTITGYLIDTATNEPITFAGIINIDNRKTVMSNLKGKFKIEVKEKEMLSFAAVGYNYDTVFITPDLLKKDTVIIYLHPLAQRLADVTVTAKSKLGRYQLDSIDRHKAFFIHRSDAKIPIVSTANSGVGMGINLDHFYSRENRKRNAIDLFNEIEDQSYINYRFTPIIVKKYANLSDENLLTFMQKYRPSTLWLRQHANEEDLLYYINDKLKDFRNGKDFKQ